MAVRNLSFMMEPTSVALITDSQGSSPIGSAVARNLVRSGFRGKILAVDLKGEIVESASNYPNIDSLPEPPDLAVLSTAPESIPDQITRLGTLGTKAAVIISREGVERGVEHGTWFRTAILEAAGPSGIRIAGPGSLGIMTPDISLNASLAHVQPLKGNFAFVAQSGSVLACILDWATSRDIGFSHLIALGGMIDVDFGDMLDYLANDLNTQAILLYIESVTQARKFMSAARLAARMKPVVVLKGGLYRNGARSSILHSKGTPGSDAVYDAAFRRAGMLRVHDIRELFDAVESLARAKTVPGDRLAILTNGWGMGVLAADALIEQGGSLAELSADSMVRLGALLPARWGHGNPLDLQGDASPMRYAEALEVLLDDGGIDSVLVVHCPNAVESGTEIARTIVETMKKGNRRSQSNRLFTSWVGDTIAAGARGLFMESRIATYDTPRDAVCGFMRIVRYRRSQEVLMQTPPSIPGEFLPDSAGAQRIIDRAVAEARDWLTEEEVKSVLDAYGIPGREAARGSDAYRLIIGVFNDAQFGPVILFGHGGDAEQAIQDKALALPPLNMHLARELMTRTRIYGLLEGGHGMRAADIEGIALVLVKVSQLICDIRQIVELRINPLLADEHGLSLLEAHIRVAGVVDAAMPHMAVSPYPKELEQEVRLPDGHTLLLRPIRPEDEPAYVRLFESLPPEDIWMRFLSRMNVLPHNLAARLTQIDYDRELALVLVGKSGSGETELLGGVRFCADADNERAEFAILLHRHVTGMGLGPLMLRNVIEAARNRGIRELFGEVLSENYTMLKLCKAFGFSVKRMPEEPGVFVVSLAL